MVKPVQWPRGSQRELLRLVDARRGPESLLIKDNKEAIRNLRDSLINSLDASGIKKYDFGDGRNALPMTEIRRTIDSLWSDRLAKFTSSDIDVFYREGSIALDWDKLVSRSGRPSLSCKDQGPQSVKNGTG